MASEQVAPSSPLTSRPLVGTKKTHVRQSLPSTKLSSVTHPDVLNKKSKPHSMAYNSNHFNELARTTNILNHPSDSTPIKRTPRYSSSFLTATTENLEVSREPESHGEVISVPKLHKEDLVDKSTSHNANVEKPKLKNRLSMQIPSVAHRNTMSRKSMGTDLKSGELFRDSKYPDFPGKVSHDPLSMPPPPKPMTRKARSNSSVHEAPAPRQLPIPPLKEKRGHKEHREHKVEHDLEHMQSDHVLDSNPYSLTTVKRRSTLASTHKTVNGSKSISSLSSSTYHPRKNSSISFYEPSTPTKIDARLMKSQTMADLTNQGASPSSASLARSKSKRINFGSPSKSPYRPLNRPAHVYPQINKKSSAAEEETDKRSSFKMRSKSTVAKQWTTLSTSLNSGTKRLLHSPFSSEFKQSNGTDGRRVLSGSRIESPLEVKDDELSEDERKIQAIMKSLVKSMPGDDKFTRKYEEARKEGKMIKEAMTPSLAAKTHHLNIYERGEILDYRNVYFTGKADVKKISGDIRHAANNYGFDDENGDYKVIQGDHIAYRYEILSVLGKGSFGKVLKCVDHKNGKLVAVKMIINRKRFHMQALIEADILRALSQWVSIWEML